MQSSAGGAIVKRLIDVLLEEDLLRHVYLPVVSAHMVFMCLYLRGRTWRLLLVDVAKRTACRCSTWCSPSHLCERTGIKMEGNVGHKKDRMCALRTCDFHLGRAS